MDYKFGLIAKDIKNSVTPMVYEAYSKDMGINEEFTILNVPEEDLVKTIEFARNNWNGFNVTMPYKVVAMQYMDELDESAVKCGSTNTVLNKDGKLIAYNTDGWGLIRALQNKGFDFKDKKVVMLGSGGVASSIAYNLDVNGVKSVDVMDITIDRSKNLTDKYGDNFTPYLFSYETVTELCKGADLYINASVMGQIGYDEYTSFEFLDGLNEGAYVFDVNYSNPDSKLVPASRAKGIPAFNGRPMTACQGIRAISIWTGKEPTLAAVDGLIERFNEMDKK